MMHPQRTATKSTNCEFTDLLISRLRRKSAMTGRTAAFRVGVERRLWADHVRQPEVNFKIDALIRFARASKILTQPHALGRVGETR
jgi:hypothetical protein